MDRSADALSQFFGVAPAAGAAAAMPVTAWQLLLSLVLAATLLGLVGGVYQRVHPGPGFRRDDAQTLIMLGMVVAVVIMVVSSRTALALAVFATFSVVRPRHKVGQSIDVGFTFLAMAIGLAVGVQAYGVAILTAVVVSSVVWLVHRLNLFAPARPSHSLIVNVTPDVDFEKVLAEPFARFVESATLQSIQSVQAGLMTELHYVVRLRKDASPRDIVQAVRERNGNNRVMLSSAMQTSQDNLT